MISWSQNSEDRLALEYFGEKKGTLLEIGANDGRTFSNSLLLIQHGWEAHLLEPASVCVELCQLHSGNDKVHIYNYGIGEKDGTSILHESGAHIHGGSDKALVSTCDYTETERWRKAGVNFIEREIQLLSFNTFYETICKPKFDYISIDAEGFDWQILRQIDLTVVSMLCIEFNSHQELYTKFTDYCAQFGMKLWHRNAENLIFIK